MVRFLRMGALFSPLHPLGTPSAEKPGYAVEQSVSVQNVSKELKNMKANLCIVTLVFVLACSLAGVALASAPAESPAFAPVPASVVADTTGSAPAAAPAETPAAPTEAITPAATNAPAASAPQPDPAPAPPAPTAPTAPTAPAAPAPAPAAPADASTAAVNPVIPLIVMDDVPLTDAIKNLARQAALNYMLDPKIAFGQMGPDGKPIPQPSVSIRWENVTAEQALTALLGNYGLQLIEDAKSHIARVTTKDPAAAEPLMTRIFQLKYCSPSNLLASVNNTFVDKRSKVVPDTRTSQLVVLATEREINGIEKLVERLDTQTKQVLIEARLVETSLNPSSVKGVDWAGTLQGQNISVGNNLQQNPPANAVNNTLSQSLPKMLLDTGKGFNPATAFLDADGVNAVLHFLNTYSEAKVLSSPRTVTLDNEPALISVTRASPIFNVTAGTANTTGGSQITYTNLGVILEVTPRISANNFVNLKVAPEVSRIFDTVTKTVAGSTYQADEYDLRRIDTHVMIPSGNTLVLGGLVQDDVRKSNSKVPLLGDIPVLGYAFRSDSQSRQKNNLLIFITPTIVQDSDYQPTKSDFLKTPPPLKDSVEGDWSSWNSGKPRDWSKPEDTSASAAAFSDWPK